MLAAHFCRHSPGAVPTTLASHWRRKSCPSAWLRSERPAPRSPPCYVPVEPAAPRWPLERKRETQATLVVLLEALFGEPMADDQNAMPERVDNARLLHLDR